MNIASSPVSATEAVSSEGIVRASVYVDGRDRGLQKARLMACYHRGPDRDRRNLGHELQQHAGTAMGIRLFHRDRRNPDCLRGSVLAIPSRGLAVSCGPAGVRDG